MLLWHTSTFYLLSYLLFITLYLSSIYLYLLILHCFYVTTTALQSRESWIRLGISVRHRQSDRHPHHQTIHNKHSAVITCVQLEPGCHIVSWWKALWHSGLRRIPMLSRFPPPAGHVTGAVTTDSPLWDSTAWIIMMAICTYPKLFNRPICYSPVLPLSRALSEKRERDVLS